jgi:hypothetical protein
VIGDEAESVVGRVSPVVVGFALAYPVVIALVLGNIKRLSGPSSD